jgi:hypothetical protein
MLLKGIVMRNNRNHNTSGVPGKRRALKEEPDEKDSRRPEGAVHEHRNRVKRNASVKSTEEVSGLKKDS